VGHGKPGRGRDGEPEQPSLQSVATMSFCWSDAMDRDWIEDASKTLDGRAMALLGHIFGGTRLRIDGKVDQPEGGFRHTLGGPEDILREVERRMP
jgi:uncharacterized protein YjbJ (UPF0337 family)